MQMIEVSQLKKRFGPTLVLKDVTFSVNRGETVVVIGPSGAGKSTMLRCLVGLEKADGGSIFIKGKPLIQDGVYAKEAVSRQLCATMGMVFQSFNLFPHMTVMQNLTSAPITVGKMAVERAQQMATTLLASIGLSEKAAAYPSALSGGQKQRVAIARALMREPDMLLFDEPTSALDPQLTAEVLAVMKQLSASHMTMLVVTHEMGFAREAADKILFMADRTVIGSGTPDEIFNQVTDPRIKSFRDSIL